jgi:ubiquinone/menaquinone biosynthesis C-methylase UbiE
METRSRLWRRRYYDLVSRVYDRFIELHARKDESRTRSFLVESAGLENIEKQRVLDVCCGTGAVLLAFAGCNPRGNFFGCDFSLGMLLAARQKDPTGNAFFIQGNAARLPFADNSFHAVSCSHALYELKGEDRVEALYEMKRVVRNDGVVLIMEHEVPAQPLSKFMFRLRLLAMGSDDTREFLESGLKPFQKVFPKVILRRSPSGKSKLICCYK